MMKICHQNFLLPISFLSKIFLLPSILFSPPMAFYSQKILQKHFAGKISSPKESAPPKHAPQNFLPRKFLSKRICSPFCFPNFHLKEFAPPIFSLKICCQTFLLSILCLTMKFYLQNSFKIFLLAKFPPHKNRLLQYLLPKISSQENLRRKEFVSHFAPKFSFKRICSPNISSQKIAAKHFCPLYYFSQKLLPKFCSPKIFAAQTALWSSYGT